MNQIYIVSNILIEYIEKGLLNGLINPGFEIDTIIADAYRDDRSIIEQYNYVREEFYDFRISFLRGLVQSAIDRHSDVIDMRDYTELSDDDIFRGFKNAVKILDLHS